MNEDNAHSSTMARRVWWILSWAALYVAAYYASQSLPLYLKATIRPPVGVTTRYFTVLVFGPTAFIILGVLGGWRLLFIHAALLGLLVLWIVITYHEGPMNLARQLLWDDVPGKLPYLYASGAAASICVFLWDQKHKRSTADDG